MKELFEYLAQFHVDHHGTTWISDLQVVKETGTPKEELQENIPEIKIEAFLDCMITNVPYAEGLHSLTITQRRRLSLKGGVYSYLIRRRNTIHNPL